MDNQPTPLPAPAPRPSRNWVAPTVAIIGSVAVASALYYGYVTQQRINQQFLQQLVSLQTAQHNAPTITAEQVAALQSIPALAETINKLPAELATQSTQLTTINTRLDAIEKTSASKLPQRDSQLLQQFLNLKLTINQGNPFAEALAALTTHPEISEAMTPIATMAETGIKTEASLRIQLRTLLDDYHEKNPISAEQKPAPRSLVSRLNSQFEGMLHITKSTGRRDDTVALLSTSIDTNASIPALSQKIQELSAAAQPYFAEWLTAAAARQKADAIIAHIETTLANPAGAQ
jgi:hypothetical protein